MKHWAITVQRKASVLPVIVGAVGSDQLYEDEALDSEDEFESDDYDYIVDDEDEDENALWDDEEDTDEPPRKKRKKKAVFSDSDTDSDDIESEEYEKERRSFAKEQRLIDELESDAKEHPIEDEDQKFLLFLWALRQYSSARIADIRGQTDRNIRKVRNTMMKKIRKKLLAALIQKVQTQQPLTLLEKEFLSKMA